jgi:hypothetical protein
MINPCRSKSPGYDDKLAQQLILNTKLMQKDLKI